MSRDSFLRLRYEERGGKNRQLSERMLMFLDHSITSKVRHIFLFLMIACFSFFCGRWYGCSECRVCCGRVLVFQHHAETFTAYVASLPDSQSAGPVAINGSLASIGVIKAWLDGDAFMFLLEKTYPDDADEIFVYFRKRDGDFLRSLVCFRNDAKTYHVQYLSQPGWYFWRRN